MTELMEWYEKETGKKAILDFGSSGEVYAPLYVQWLEAQLRWRPVSEKPKESDRYMVKYRQGKIVKKFIADYDVVYGWNMPLPVVEIIEWLPIPPAPEGESQ